MVNIDIVFHKMIKGQEDEARRRGIHKRTSQVMSPKSDEPLNYFVEDSRRESTLFAMPNNNTHVRRSQLLLGISKINYIILTCNLFFGLLLLLVTHRVFYQSIVIVLISATILYKWGYASRKVGDHFPKEQIGFSFYLSHILSIFLLMWFDYDLIGSVNKHFGGLNLYDNYLLSFDLFLFKMPVADFFEKALLNTGFIKNIFYDILMIAYICYYPLVYLGIIHFSSFKNDPKKFSLINQYSFSMVVLLLLSFIGYLLIPVTGPQYYLKEQYGLHMLPLSFFGLSIHNYIAGLHPNHIDCFPSVHTGLTILTVFWAFKMKFKARYIYLLLSLFIIPATILLRYHYILDVLAAIPCALIAYQSSKIFFPEETGRESP
ncbi:MAG: phosphatase PAP2 family protein [Oligoflexia bacterium]|nr:phosphatase PAP2 family protein [Oligoflexia bacterium]